MRPRRLEHAAQRLRVLRSDLRLVFFPEHALRKLVGEGADETTYLALEFPIVFGSYDDFSA